MTGAEALKELKLGHKIRKPYWRKSLYIILDDEQIIYYSSGSKYPMFDGSFLEDDWELYEI